MREDYTGAVQCLFSHMDMMENREGMRQKIEATGETIVSMFLVFYHFQGQPENGPDPTG